MDFIVQLQYTCIAVSGSWLVPPWETLLSTGAQCLRVVPFAFSLTDLYFWSYLSQHLFSSISFSQIILYICNTVSFFCHSLRPILLLNNFNWHILRFTFCTIKSSVSFDKCSVMYPLLQCHQNCFTTLKNFITYLTISHSFQIPDNYWSFSCLYNFDFPECHIIGIIKYTAFSDWRLSIMQCPYMSFHGLVVHFF